MFGTKRLKIISVITVFFFVWSSVTSDIAASKKEKYQYVFLKVKEYNQEGAYDKSIKLLKDYIEKAKMSIKIQEEYLAEAYYQLARIYYILGKENKTNEKLKMVFQIEPKYSKYVTDEDYMEFRKKVDTFKREYKVAKDDVNIITQPGKKKKKKLTFWLIAGGVLASVVVLYFLLKKKKKPIISITSPMDGETVCYEGFNPYGESIITVRGTKSGRDLESSEKIVVLVKESGGGIWWVSGEIISAAEANTGSWQMQNVSIGKPGDPITQYKITAVVTTASLSSGQHVTELPNHKASSNVIMITRGGPCQ